MSPANISSGFIATGIWPIDKTTMDKYYKPSKPYHRPTQARTPAAEQGEDEAAAEQDDEEMETAGNDGGHGMPAAAQEVEEDLAAAAEEATRCMDDYIQERNHWAWMDGQVRQEA